MVHKALDTLIYKKYDECGQTIERPSTIGISGYPTSMCTQDSPIMVLCQPVNNFDLGHENKF